MKRNKILILTLIMINVLFMPNIKAANRAYSVGSKYANGVIEAGSDFTQNVLNAANAYGKLSGYTSYYSNEPDYNYMKGSRLGSSQVYFINGHANGDTISTAAKNTDDYRTGISIYKDGAKFKDKINMYWKTAGLEGRDMSNTKLITFVGCETAQADPAAGTVYGSKNLVTVAFNQGAKTAVGFTQG